MSDSLDLAHADPARADLKRRVHEELMLKASLHRDYTIPFLEAQVDGTKNLVTIASGAIVGSVSVVQFVREKEIDLAAGWLLAGSWMCFAVAIWAGLGRIGGLRAASGIAVALIKGRDELLQVVETSGLPFRRSIGPRQRCTAERARKPTSI